MDPNATNLTPAPAGPISGRATAPTTAPLRAALLLRSRPLWVTPTLFGCVVVMLMALIYIGSLVNPLAQLHGLPVFLVNQDQGATAGQGRVSFGDQVATQITGAPQVQQSLSVRTVSLAEAQREMDAGSGYLTIVIPPTFTQSMLQLTGRNVPATSTPSLPTVELLTNPRLGSAGVALATGVVTGAIHPNDPIAISTVEWRPLPATSALGLSAFYLSLLATMCGFLGATLVSSAVDAGLGFSTTELGPRWRQRRPILVSRWQTLLTKWTIAGALVPVLTGIVVVVAVGVLGLDAPGAGYVWLLMTLSALGVAMGTLALLAALGSVGQLSALILFVYLALASSGATIPTQAIPQPFRLVSHVDPLRRTVDALRAVLYFNGDRHAGWPTACLVLGLELLCWLVLGAVVTSWYDRRGLSRLPVDLGGSAAKVETSEPGDDVARRRLSSDLGADLPGVLEEVGFGQELADQAPNDPSVDRAGIVSETDTPVNHPLG